MFKVGLLAIFLAMPAPAQEGPAPWLTSTPPGHFLRVESLDLDKALPPPPADGSLAHLADLEAVLQAQVWRTPEQMAWAKQIENDTVWQFASVLGTGFRAEALPKAARFFWQITVDTHAISEHLKGRFHRLRPPKVDARIRPCVFLPPNDSYPSGHALQAYVRAGVLAELFPEMQEALFARAHRAAWGRILGGVHYPTDVIGGRALAEAILAKLKANPDFHAALEGCRAEIRLLEIKKAV